MNQEEKTKIYENRCRQNKNLELAVTNTRYENLDIDPKSISNGNISLNDKIIKYLEDNKKYWYDDKNVDELEFATLYLHVRPLIYYRQFYDINGTVNITILKKELTYILKKYVKSGKLLRAVDNVVEFLTRETYVESYKPNKNTIHVQNATLVINNNFEIEVYPKEITINRLNVNYVPTNITPQKWLAFLDNLLIPMDIEILQEFIGYCLIATVEKQKALLIIGKQGGEGKSTILSVLQKMFGNDSMTQKTLHKIFEKFGFARVNNKLIIFDDDMKPLENKMLEPLKKFISLEEIEYEAKYSMEESVNHYARLIGLGNNILDNIKSNDTAFNRRLIVLNVKPKDLCRVDNPKLVEELSEELDEIFNWALDGLIRLLKNNFEFSYEEEMQKRVSDILKDDSDSYIHEFLKDNNFVEYDEESEELSMDLYDAYRKRCLLNHLEILSDARFYTDLHRVSILYGIKPKNKVRDKMRRGYQGIRIKRQETLSLNPDKDTKESDIEYDNPF